MSELQVAGCSRLTMLPLKDLLFTQDSVSARFKNGKLLSQSVEGLCNGSLEVVQLPPMDVVTKDGCHYCLANRRLWVFKQFAMRSPQDWAKELADAVVLEDNYNDVISHWMGPDGPDIRVRVVPEPALWKRQMTNTVGGHAVRVRDDRTLWHSRTPWPGSLRHSCAKPQHHT